MNRKPFKLRPLLIGFVLTKMVVTGLYFVVTWTPGLLLTQQTAEAQDVASGQDAVAEQKQQTVEAGDEGPAGAEMGEKYAEVSALMEQLEMKRLQLKDEEERIKQEQDQLEQLKRDIDLKLDELAVVQAKIDASLAEQAQIEAQAQKSQEEAEAAKIKQLVKVYTSMKASKAAEIINKLDMNVIYEVFSNMKGEQVGQILTYVDGDRAAEITERLASNSAE
jgi:flagellar motility protein MotE (MotC chaperone)